MTANDAPENEAVNSVSRDWEAEKGNMVFHTAEMPDYRYSYEYGHPDSAFRATGAVGSENQLPVVDAGKDETLQFPSGYREYLETMVPTDDGPEYQYMYLFGDLPWSMDSSRKVPQGKIDEMMTAVAVERLREGNWNPAMGRSDLVTHADISKPTSEEAVSAFEEAVRKVIDSRAEDVTFKGEILMSANEASDETEGEEKQ